MASQLTSKEAFAKLPQRLHNFFIKYPPRPFAEYAAGPSTITDPLRNPFFPNKNQETGRWQDAKYSRRRSADLFKLAKKFGVHEMLPPTPRKFYEDKYNNKNWIDSMVNPIDEVKAAEYETRMKEKAEAIANMDNIIAAVRPTYNKSVEKREKRKKTWF